jgi:hypothetical protein
MTVVVLRTDFLPSKSCTESTALARRTPLILRTEQFAEIRFIAREDGRDSLLAREMFVATTIAA